MTTKISIRLIILLFFLQSGLLQSADFQPRIIGGIDADSGEWPATAALLLTNVYNSELSSGSTIGEAQYSAQYCAGSLVAPNVVLTAAHCLFDEFSVPLAAADILVLAAVTDLTETGQLLEVLNITIHPDFNSTTFDSDIALLQLNPATPASAPAANMPLFSGDPAVGASATVLGWGVTSTTILSSFPEILQEADLLVDSNISCNSATSYNGAITDNMLCASAAGKDSCGGDSGGPLMSLQDGQYHQVGIVSFGTGCALEDFPGVYTRVDRFRSWIIAMVNLPPMSDSQSLITDEDTPLMITLTGSDPDNDALAYTLIAQPGNGVLTGTVPTLTYTPDNNYNGPDSFSFQVNDGEFSSTTATVTIAVNGVNDAPSADIQSIVTDEDTAVMIGLTGTDPDGDLLTYTVVSQPTAGVLTGIPPALTYTPNANFNGSDSFTFLVNDGIFDSIPASVSITANAVNDAPVADQQSITLDEDTMVAITLTGTDPDDDTLTYSVMTQPANGVLSGIAPALTYTPDASYSGADSFTFAANDGALDSVPATVSITVNDTATATGGGGGGSFGWLLFPAGLLMLLSRRVRLPTSHRSSNDCLCLEP